MRISSPCERGVRGHISSNNQGDVIYDVQQFSDEATQLPDVHSPHILRASNTRDVTTAYA